MFERIYNSLERISKVAVWVGGMALMLSAIMVTIDVITRKLFGITMSGSDEISGYVFAAATTWAFSYCLVHRANVRIDALYNLLSRRARAVLDLLGMLLLLLYVSVLAYKAVFVFQETIDFNATAQTTLATPLWIPQIFWLIGLLFFLITLVFVTVYTFVALLKRDYVLVSKIAGVRTVEEELDEDHWSTGGVATEPGQGRGER